MRPTFCENQPPAFPYRSSHETQRFYELSGGSSQSSVHSSNNSTGRCGAARRAKNITPKRLRDKRLSSRSSHYNSYNVYSRNGVCRRGRLMENRKKRYKKESNKRWTNYFVDTDELYPPVQRAKDTKTILGMNYAKERRRSDLSFNRTFSSSPYNEVEDNFRGVRRATDDNILKAGSGFESNNSASTETGTDRNTGTTNSSTSCDNSCRDESVNRTHSSVERSISSGGFTDGLKTAKMLKILPTTRRKTPVFPPTRRHQIGSSDPLKVGADLHAFKSAQNYADELLDLINQQLELEAKKRSMLAQSLRHVGILK